MAETVELATAYVSLVPSFSGVQGVVARELGAPIAAEGTKSGKAFGSNLTKAVAVGALAAGAAAAVALTKGLQQEAVADTVGASLGATEADAARYGKAGAQVFAAAWGESTEETTRAVGTVVSSIEGMRTASDGEITAMTSKVFAFSDAFQVDFARSAQVAGQLVKAGLADNATEGLDLLTATLQKVPEAVREDVLDAADEYGPFFAQLGLSGEQAFSMLAANSDKGMYGIDKVGDAMKEFTTLVTTDFARTEPVIDGLGLNYDQLANDMLAGGDKAAAATQTIIGGLQDIGDPAKQAQAAIELFGTPLEDLGSGQIPGFLDALSDGGAGLGDFAGATELMSDQMGDNALTKLTSFGRQAQVTLVDFLGSKALPAVEGVATALSAGFGPAVADAGAFLGNDLLPVLGQTVDSLGVDLGPVLAEAGIWVGGLATDLSTNLGPALLAAAQWLRDDLVPGLQATVAWVQANRTPITIIAGVIAALLLPALISWGVQSTVAGAANVAAWLTSRATATSSAAAQFAAHYRVVAGWIASAARATASGAVTVAIWAMLQADALRSAATQVAAHARMAGAWLVSRGQAVAAGVVIGAQWIAIGARSVASAAVQVGANVAAAASFALTRAAMLGSIAVQAALRGATLVAAAAQWAMNAALSANPIGIVIVAVAALVAGLIWFFTQTKLGREIVAKAMAGIQAAIGWVTDKAAALFGWVRTNWPAIQHFLTLPLRLAWDGINAAIGWIRDRFWGTVGWVQNVFAVAWAALQRILTDPIGAARDAIWALLGKAGLQKVFRDSVAALGSIWDGLRSKLKEPISFMINTVINDGLVGAYGKVRGFLPFLPEIGRISVPGFQRGVTEVPGNFHPQHRDSVLAVTGKGWPIARVEPGEAITPRDATRRSYGLLEAIRTGALSDAMVPGFRTGGVAPVPGPGRRHTSGYPWATWAGDYPVAMGTPVRAWKAGIIAAVRYLTRSYGFHVRMNHGDSTSSLYAHLSKILVSPGQRLGAGEVLGRVGSTGKSTGPHLHFESKGGTAPIQSGGGGGLVDAVMSAIDVDRRIKDLMDGPLGRIADQFGGGMMSDIAAGIPRLIVDKLIGHAKGLAGYATGTSAAEAGLATVAERGAELVLGRQVRRFGGGEQVLDARTTAALLGRGPSVTPEAIRRALEGMELRLDGLTDRVRLVMRREELAQW